jgi:uncharacterized protein DUF4232
MAVAGSAALALGLGSAAWAATSASAAPNSVIPKCGTGNLAVWVSPDRGDGAAGSVYYPLEFTNISNHTCYVYGYPGVSATNVNGTQLGDAAARDNGVPARVVNIAPGGTAHAVLRYIGAEVSTSGCKPANASFLKVYPPDQFSARRAFFDLPACTVSKHVYLTIRRIQPGA